MSNRLLGQFAESLARTLAGEPSSVDGPATAPPPAEMVPARRWSIAGAAALVIVIALVGRRIHRELS